MTVHPKTEYYHHGRLSVKGGVLPDAITAYRTYGERKNPCIVFPTCYGGKLDSQDYMIGEGKALNPKDYFIVTFALFSNGESSSPSNTAVPYNGPYFPAVSYEDNIRAQHAVLTKKLGIEKVHMVIGFSMGGQQAYFWAVVFPDFIEKYVAICGSARTSPHNQCFLEGPKAALLASKDFDGGHYQKPPQHGLRAFGRVYSAWAYGQTWFREHGYKQGDRHPDLNSFLREEWEASFLQHWDANDLLVLLDTWQSGDVSQVRDNGNLTKTLSEIKARGLIMPCKTDLYFPPEDSDDEVSCMGNSANLVVIDSVWGHMGEYLLIIDDSQLMEGLAGGGANAQDDEFIRAEVDKFLKG